MRHNDFLISHFQEDFYSRTNINMILSIFNYMEDICFFIKDISGRLVAVNYQLIERYGLSGEVEILGKTDFDVLPYSLAEKYKKDDMKVIETKQPILGIVELVLNKMNVPSWFATNKIPVIDKNNNVIGIMGTISKLENDKLMKDTDLFFNQVVEFMLTNSSEKNLVKKSAKHFNMSQRTLERYFTQYLNITPQHFIMRTRIYNACEFLKSGKSILSVSIDCGFYDQSTFTRQFKKHMGITPMQYIKKM